MTRQTPTDLANEILAKGSPWSLVSARLRPPEVKDGGYVSVDVGGATCWSGIALDRGARHAVGALKRSGYEILSIRSKPFHARRPLRGIRELDAEVRRLEALARDRTTIATFPSRALRRPGLPAANGLFSVAGFNRLRHAHAWVLEWVSVGRRGPASFVGAPTWTTAAWCLFLDDGDDRWIEVDVHLFQKGRQNLAKGDDFATLTGAARDHLAPFGYRAVKLLGPKRPPYAVFSKRVVSLSEARRERKRLDKDVFRD
jgi:hypothetical protein